MSDSCTCRSCPVHAPDWRAERKEPPSRGRVLRLKRAVAQAWDVTILDLSGPYRRLRDTIPRHAAAYLLRKRLGLSYPEIARLLGRKDHTAALYGIRGFEERLAASPELRERVARLESHLDREDAEYTVGSDERPTRSVAPARRLSQEEIERLYPAGGS